MQVSVDGKLTETVLAHQEAEYMLKITAALRIHSNPQHSLLTVKSETHRQHISILLYWGFGWLFWYFFFFIFKPLNVLLEGRSSVPLSPFVILKVLYYTSGFEFCK